MPDILHPIFDAQLVDLAISVFDLETTGLHPHTDAIIQMAVVNIKDGNTANEWKTFIDPGAHHRPISDFITDLTGIEDSQLTGAPSLSMVMKQFDAQVGTKVVGGHNIAGFDLKFIRRAERVTGIDVQSLYYVDSLKIMRRLHPGLEGKKLIDCGRFYDIDFDEENLHDALHDTRLGAQVLMHQFRELADKNVHTFAQMLDFLS